MSLLRKKCIACIPDVEPAIHEFKQSRSVEEIVPVFNKDGKKVREVRQRSVVYDSIPSETWENKGVKASLFSLENQVNAGVDVSEFKGNFIGLDLDKSDSLGTQFIESVNSYVAEHSKQQVVESNNDE